MSNPGRNTIPARWAACCLLLLICAASALALGTGRALREYGHQAWRSDTGLPQNTVHAITQTRDGYLWAGTEGGLVRFDGTEFQTFDRGNTPALPSDIINALAEDEQGALWVSTPAGLVVERGGAFAASGLAGASLGAYRTRGGQVLALTPAGVFVAHMGSFLRLPGSDQLGLSEGASLVAEDASGRILVAGATRVQAYSAQFAATGPSIDISEAGEVQAIAGDGSGAVFVGGASGLLVIRHGRADASPVAALPSRQVTCLLAARGEGMWIGTGKGLLFYDHGTAHPVPELAGARIERLFLDRAGMVWAATSRGLSRIAPGGIELSAPLRALPQGVLAIFEDREGSMWFGTDTAGLHVLRDQPFSTLGVDDGLSSGLVRAVFEDHAGTMWFGTSGGGLDRLQQGRVSAFPGRLPSRVVLALAESARPPATPATRPEYDLWIGTPEGLVRFRDGQSRLFTTADGLADDFVRSLYADRDGSLWVGTRNGLTHMQEGAGPPSYSRAYTRSYSRLDGLGSDLIGAILRARDGTLWVGTLGGLSRMQGDRFVDAPAGPRVAVTALLEDSQGALWFGTEGSGLWRLRHGEASSLSPRVPQVQPSGSPAPSSLPATIYGLLEDGFGSLWLSSRSGIDRVQLTALNAALDAAVHGSAAGGGAALPVEHYGTPDGMRIREASGGGHPAAWRARDGSLWFATLDGAALVHPRAMARAAAQVQVAPLAAIEQVAINDALLSAPIPAGGAGSITIPPGQGRLTIRYAGLSFVAPQKVRYRYRLLGFDPAWVDAGTRRTAFYTNVPPGSYRFLVAASNGEGVWSETPAEVRFTVKPYVYQTWWFYALLLCAAAGLAFAIYRWRMHRLHAQVGAQYRAVLEERGRIAREIHDTLAQGYVAVSVQLELAERLLAHSPDAALGQLRQTKELVREELEEARSSIWNLRAQADAETLPALLAAHISSRMERRGVHQREPVLRFAVHGAYRPLARAIEDEVRRIAQEAVANAITHARARHITLALRYDPVQLVLTVADDGVGLQTSAGGSEHSFEGRGHFGMQGMRERAARIGAALTIGPRQQAPDPATVNREPVEAHEALTPGTVVTLVLALGPTHRKGKLVNEPIRIMIVEDHHIVRQGFVALLKTIEDFSVVAEAADGESAVAAYDQHQPDVTLMDLRLPGIGGVETITRIRGKHGEARIVVLTTFDGDEDIYRALQAGARGYLLKGMEISELVEAIRSVHRGKSRIPPAVAERLAERLAGPALTERETDVLKLIVAGKSNKEIASALFISEATVKTHINNLLSKLGVTDRTQAATTALQRGIVHFD